jgi:hypothetical protein
MVRNGKYNPLPSGPVDDEWYLKAIATIAPSPSFWHHAKWTQKSQRVLPVAESYPLSYNRDPNIPMQESSMSVLRGFRDSGKVCNQGYCT